VPSASESGRVASRSASLWARRRVRCSVLAAALLGPLELRGDDAVGAAVDAGGQQPHRDRQGKLRPQECPGHGQVDDRLAELH
jgi:hypothetical protein